MSPPGKETGGLLQPPINKDAPSVYEADNAAQERFWREAERLFRAFLRTGNEKHLRAFHRLIDGIRHWKGTRARLERVYAQTGRSKPGVMYALAQCDRKRNARQPRNNEGDAR
jgi:hypothetical protein